MSTKFDQTTTSNSLDIAVIGMSCIFPKAKNKEQFWANLCNGVETVKNFTDEELVSRGVPAEILKNPDYVKAGSVLDNYDAFDAEFFGINPNEAKCMDPQHRLFLECCWEALEDAGYNPDCFDGDIGVFAGLGMNTYLYDVLTQNDDFLKSVSQEQIMIGNDKDFLPTRVSYKLNLKGPSVNVNTACSTSLVAMHLARQSLLLGECDMILAGGVSVYLQNNKGYMYMKDGIQSPDGHCRAFDARAKGTIWGDGCGVVLLKRLADAIDNRDHIYAVIKGSAINNDGSNKVGYTAPGVDGQSKVIVEALTVAGLSPEEISYVETHGTGTQLGDPVEIAALTQAFCSSSEKRHTCPIGSVKTNIGHLNAAAGIAGFIKTVLAIQNKILPPSLNFENPNPKIDFESSPFYVNTKLADWNNGAEPLRAGISAMGIGGTNCHVIIEEAPALIQKEEKDELPEEYILVLSARSSKAFEDAAQNLASYLDAHPELSLKDVAYTLQCGRKAFSYRRAIVCNSIADAVHILRNKDQRFLLEGTSINNSNKSFLHESMLKAWLMGEDVDWSSVWKGLSPGRVPLPTYPFERKSYWVEPKIANILKKPTNEDGYFKKIDDMADWFYLPSWKHSSLPFAAKENASKTRLIFADTLQIGDSIARKLKQEGDTVIVVTIGKCYEQTDESSFVLDPADPEGYQQMLSILQNSGKLPDSILFFWSLEAVQQEQKLKLDWDFLISAQEKGFFSMLHLTKALEKLAVTSPIEFTVFTNNVFDILGNEELNIHASTIYGICLLMQQTYGHFICRVIDILLPASGTTQHEDMVEILMNEITHNASELLCAYRGTKRYIRRYDPVRVEADAPQDNAIHKDGIYLVFSGLEGIGSIVSEHIIQKGAKLLILEEEDFPNKENWEKWIKDNGENHPVSMRIKNAVKFLENGAEYVGTIANLRENERLLDNVEKRFGTINGIIHAPGASNAKRIRAIRNSSPETWYEHFRVVCYSLITLDQIFKNKDLDFRIMLNSLGSVLGGDGFINITTVSNYAKAYITLQSHTDKQPWIVHCWDSWIIEWGQIKEHMPTAIYGRVEPSVLTDEEGIKCFEQTFAVKNTVELEISATNLSNRYNKWVKLDSLRKAEVEKKENNLKHPRPELATAYVSPQNQTEKWMEDVFSDLLGIDKIGINDNFFELGGHSLLGIQLASKIRNKYFTDIDIYYIYQYPTIADLSTYLNP